MKTYFKFCLLIFILNFGYSQELSNEKTKQKSKITFEPTCSFGLIKSIPFGSNALNEGYQSDVGFTSALSLIDFKKFSMGIGFEFIPYYVENSSLVGNFDRSNLNIFQLQLRYRFDVSKEFKVLPRISYGKGDFSLRKEGTERGNQDIEQYKISTFLEYYFSKNTGFAFGIHYALNLYDINTNPAIFDFFRRSNEIQLSLEIKFK